MYLLFFFVGQGFFLKSLTTAAVANMSRCMESRKLRAGFMNYSVVFLHIYLGRGELVSGMRHVTATTKDD